MLDHLLPFAISLLIGLLIGIERERSHKVGVQAIGVRSFMLFSLLGTLAATLNQIALTVTLSTFVFSILLLSYLRTTRRIKKEPDVGITTEISAGMMFCLGYLTTSDPLIAITISGVILLILIERKRLHTLARHKLKPQEIEALIILTIFAVGIIPILPDRTIDPWQFFNPRNFGILLAVIAGIQFAGYVAIRMFGQHSGRAVSGFLGGLISSTAVFAALPATLGNAQLLWSTMASALLAVVAGILELVIILLVASPSLFIVVGWPLAAMVATGLAAAIFSLQLQKRKETPVAIALTPINLSALARSALFIATILLIIAITKQYVGTEGTLLASFLGGLFELHGVSLAAALLYLENQLTLIEVETTLAAAVLASFISKFFLLWTLMPRYFAWRASFFLFIILISGKIVFWVVS